MVTGTVARILLWACVLLATHTSSQVNQPPVISVPVEATIRYEFPDASFDQECKASGEPAPIYQWLKDGQPLESNEYVGFDSRTGLLSFNQFSRRDGEGEYMCIATIQYDMGPGVADAKASSMSAPVTILAIIVGNFGTDPIDPKAGYEYDYMTIPCANQGDIQQARTTYNWYDGNSRTSRLGDDNGRMFIDAQGGLHFVYLKLSDGDVSQYACGITNELTSIVLGSHTQLIVNQIASRPSFLPPILQYSNDPVEATLYSDAVLECFFSGYSADGNEMPQTTWYINPTDILIPDGIKYELSDDRRKLTIKNLQREDEKTYYCSAKLKTEETEPFPVRLDLKSAPFWMEENGAPVDQTKPESADAMFYCHAQSLPGEAAPSQPVWYINAKKADASLNAAHYVFSADKTSLKITDLRKPEDIQCVQCEVSNDYGSTWGDGCLNVILAITITKQPDPLRQEIRKGDTVDLTVLGTTDESKELSYKFFFKNVSYDLAPPHVTYNPTTKEAYINTSLLCPDDYKSIAGLYQRKLYHDDDEVYVDIEVVLGDKEPVELPSEAPEVTIAGQIYQGTDQGNKITLTEGFTGDVTCLAKGGYPDAYDTRLTCGSRGITGAANSATLSFQADPLTKEMNGDTCTCTAQHISGCYDMETTLTLEVQYKPSLTLTPASAAELDEGDPITIECDGEGNPPASLRLARGRTGEDLARVTAISGSETTSLDYEVISSACLDTDTYICYGSNTVGTVTQQVAVNVRCPQHSVNVRDNVIDAVIGEQLQLYLIIYGYPEPNSIELLTMDNDADLTASGRYSVTYIPAQPPYGSLLVTITDVRSEDITNYTITVDNCVGVLLYKFSLNQVNTTALDLDASSDNGSSISSLTLGVGLTALIIIIVLVAVVILMCREVKRLRQALMHYSDTYGPTNGHVDHTDNENKGKYATTTDKELDLVTSEHQKPTTSQMQYETIPEPRERPSSNVYTRQL